MIFTDHDLKQLKDAIKGSLYVNIGDNEYGDPNEVDIKALVARLEAAEKLCDHDTDQCENEFQGCYRCRLTKLWSKSKGEIVAGKL